MRALTNAECDSVAGAEIPPFVVVGAAALLGGLGLRALSSCITPISTPLATIGAGVGGAMLGTPLAPGPGTLIGAVTGAAVGYLFSEPLLNFALFVAGAGAAGFAAYQYLP